MADGDGPNLPPPATGRTEAMDVKERILLQLAEKVPDLLVFVILVWLFMGRIGSLRDAVTALQIDVETHLSNDAHLSQQLSDLERRLNK